MLRPQRRRVLGVAPSMLLAAISIGALYWWSYGDAVRTFFLNDDYYLLDVTSRITIASPWDVAQFFRPAPFFLLYRPISTVMYFYALRAAFGHDPTWYHVVHLLFHIANALLVCAVATRLLKSTSAGLTAGLVYATAPGHALAAFWLSTFTMTGTAFFYFLALYVWFGPAWRWRVASTHVLFVLALLASEHAITLPIALTAGSVILETRPDWRRIVHEQAVLYVIVGLYVGAKLYYMHWILPVHFSPVEYTMIASNYAVDLDPRSLMRNLGFYFSHALPPLYEPAMGASTAVIIGSLLAGSCVVAGGIVVWRQARMPWRVAAYGLTLFVVTLAPVLVLPAHASSYYVGIAALGTALAFAGAARGVPWAPTIASAAVVVVFVGMHVGSTAARVRNGAELKIYNGFSESTAGWLYTAATMTRGRGVLEVVVPDGSIDPMAVVHDAHKVLLCAPYALRASKDMRSEAPTPGRLVLTHAAPLPVAHGWRRDWSWIPTTCNRDGNDAVKRAAEDDRSELEGDLR